MKKRKGNSDVFNYFPALFFFYVVVKNSRFDDFAAIQAENTQHTNNRQNDARNWPTDDIHFHWTSALWLSLHFFNLSGNSTPAKRKHHKRCTHLTHTRTLHNHNIERERESDCYDDDCWLHENGFMCMYTHMRVLRVVALSLSIGARKRDAWWWRRRRFADDDETPLIDLLVVNATHIYVMENDSKHFFFVCSSYACVSAFVSFFTQWTHRHFTLSLTIHSSYASERIHSNICHSKITRCLHQQQQQHHQQSSRPVCFHMEWSGYGRSSSATDEQTESRRAAMMMFTYDDGWLVGDGRHRKCLVRRCRCSLSNINFIAKIVLPEKCEICLEERTKNVMDLQFNLSMSGFKVIEYRQNRLGSYLKQI